MPIDFLLLIIFEHFTTFAFVLLQHDFLCCMVMVLIEIPTILLCDCLLVHIAFSLSFSTYD